jgi:5-formyltetrahydrofolate cyclo-ligase
MVQTKVEWRRALLKARSAIPKDVHRLHSAAIAHRVGRLACVSRVRSILGYCAIGGEVDPAAVLDLVGIAEIPRYVPAPTDGHAPRWVPWPGLPVEGAEPAVSTAMLAYPVLAFVPGVGFDQEGTRLGRGAGFYDRALADLRRRGTVCAVALAFECQIVPELPADPWDERVDCIVTERRIIETGGHAIALAERPQ